MKNDDILTDLDLDVYNAIQKIDKVPDDNSAVLYLSVNNETAATKMISGTPLNLSLCLANAIRDDNELLDIVVFSLVTRFGFENGIDVPTAIKKIGDILHGNN